MPSLHHSPCVTFLKVPQGVVYCTEMMYLEKPLLHLMASFRSARTGLDWSIVRIITLVTPHPLHSPTTSNLPGSASLELCLILCELWFKTAVCQTSIPLCLLLWLLKLCPCYTLKRNDCTHAAASYFSALPNIQAYPSVATLPSCSD